MCTVGTLYSAYDNVRNEVVALKVEKPGKSKKVLQLEYNILHNLQGLPYICPVYEFIESGKKEVPNLIVMKMLGNERLRKIGKNLAMVKRQRGRKFTFSCAIALLVNCVRSVAPDAVCNRGGARQRLHP